MVDTANLLGDADGGRIKVQLRNHENKSVRTYTIEFYAELEADFGKPPADGRYYWSINSYGQEYGDQLLGKGGNFRIDVAAAPWTCVTPSCPSPAKARPPVPPRVCATCCKMTS